MFYVFCMFVYFSKCICIYKHVRVCVCVCVCVCISIQKKETRKQTMKHREMAWCVCVWGGKIRWRAMYQKLMILGLTQPLAYWMTMGLSLFIYKMEMVGPALVNLPQSLWRLDFWKYSHDLVKSLNRGKFAPVFSALLDFLLLKKCVCFVNEDFRAPDFLNKYSTCP
jgi:hypothetical protein